MSKILAWLRKILRKDIPVVEVKAPTRVFLCPSCKGFLRKQPGWDIYHCVPCQRSIDLWHDQEPEYIESDTLPEEYNHLENVHVISLK